MMSVVNANSELSAKSDRNFIELKGKTDDEDGETGFDDWSTAVRNICEDNRLPTNTKSSCTHSTLQINHGASSV